MKAIAFVATLLLAACTSAPTPPAPPAELWQKLGMTRPRLDFRTLQRGKFEVKDGVLALTRADAELAQREGLIGGFAWSADDIVLEGVQHGEIARIRFLGGERPFALVATPRDLERFRGWKLPKYRDSRLVDMPNEVVPYAMGYCAEYGVLCGHDFRDGVPYGFFTARGLAEDGARLFDHYVYPYHGGGSDPWDGYRKRKGIVYLSEIRAAAREGRERELLEWAAKLKPVWTADLAREFGEAHVGFEKDLERTRDQVRLIAARNLVEAFEPMASTVSWLSTVQTHEIRWKRSLLPFYREAALLVADRCEETAKGLQPWEAPCWEAMAKSWRILSGDPSSFGGFQQHAVRCAGVARALEAWRKRALLERIAEFHAGHDRLTSGEPTSARAVAVELVFELEAAVRLATECTPQDVLAWNENLDRLRSLVKDATSLPIFLAAFGEVRKRSEVQIRRAIASGRPATAIGFVIGLAERDVTLRANLQPKTLCEALGAQARKQRPGDGLGLEVFADLAKGSADPSAQPLDEGALEKLGQIEIVAILQRLGAELVAQNLPVIARDDPHFAKFAWLDDADPVFGILEVMRFLRLRIGKHEDLVAALAAVGRMPAKFSLQPDRSQDRTQVTTTTDKEQLAWSPPLTPADEAELQRHREKIQALARRVEELTRQIPDLEFGSQLEANQDAFAATAKLYQQARSNPPAALRRIGQTRRTELVRTWQVIRGNLLLAYGLTEGGATTYWGVPLAVDLRSVRHEAHAPTGTPAVDHWLTSKDLLLRGNQLLEQGFGPATKDMIVAAYRRNVANMAKACGDPLEESWLRRLLSWNASGNLQKPPVVLE